MESLENYWYEEYSKFLSFDILFDYFNIYEELCEGIFLKRCCNKGIVKR